MKQEIKLGLVCLARETYDYKASAKLFEEKKSYCKKIPSVDWTIISEQVITIEEAKNAAETLAKAHLDGIIVISGTFHLGHLVLEIYKETKVPLLLWGLPELPYDGGKIRLNSVCGVNLNASNLFKSGVDNYHAIVSDGIDETWIDALRVTKALKTAHVGLVGYRAHGFFNLSVSDTDLYSKTGVLVDHFELSEVFDTQVEDAAVDKRVESIKKGWNCADVNEEQVKKVATLAEKLSVFYAQNTLSALAIRCWPEFARDFGISPCAAMSILQSEDLILACEGDVEGALSMIAHKALGAETPFLFDFSQIDIEKNFALFWHCGVAPCNLWDGKCSRSLDTYFAGGKGVTAGFVLKSGDVSIARIDTARGKTRVFLQKATAVPMEKELSGTYLKAIFDRPVQEVLDTVIKNGIAHHASVVYGDYCNQLKLFAQLMGWEVIE